MTATQKCRSYWISPFVTAAGEGGNDGGNFWEKPHLIGLCLCLSGVAEQFALAEAAMNVWSMTDGLEEPSTSIQGWSRQNETSGSLSLLWRMWIFFFFRDTLINTRNMLWKGVTICSNGLNVDLHDYCLLYSQKNMTNIMIKFKY